MGCDIHPHIEVKINGKWEHYSSPPIQRCYGLFAKICGVRNNSERFITPIAEPRGLPPDISELTKICWDEDGGHTPTWLTGEELELVIFFHENYTESITHLKEWGYLNGNGFDVKKYPESHSPKIEDCRLVCWFDN